MTNRNSLDHSGSPRKILTAQGIVTQSVPVAKTRPATPASKHEKK